MVRGRGDGREGTDFDLQCFGPPWKTLGATGFWRVFPNQFFAFLQINKNDSEVV